MFSHSNRTMKHEKRESDKNSSLYSYIPSKNIVGLKLSENSITWTRRIR